MVWMPVTCVICGSDKYSHHSVCGNCKDRDAEADALYTATMEYVQEKIDVWELERRIWKALTAPSKPSWLGTRLVMR